VPPEMSGETGAPENLSPMGNGTATIQDRYSWKRQRRQSSRLFGDNPGEKAAEKSFRKEATSFWRGWRVWRIDNVVFEIPPEPQIQMKLGLAGSAGMREAFWPLAVREGRS
jgi:hypothetical protein